MNGKPSITMVAPGRQSIGKSRHRANAPMSNISVVTIEAAAGKLKTRSAGGGQQDRQRRVAERVVGPAAHHPRHRQVLLGEELWPRDAVDFAAAEQRSGRLSDKRPLVGRLVLEDQGTDDLDRSGHQDEDIDHHQGALGADHERERRQAKDGQIADRDHHHDRRREGQRVSPGRPESR